MSISHHSIVDACPCAAASSLHSFTAAVGCSSHAGGSRQARIRFAPQDAKDFAASKPTPLLDPVIIIHLPVRLVPGTCLSVRNVGFAPLKDCKWSYNPEKIEAMFG